MPRSLPKKLSGEKLLDFLEQQAGEHTKAFWGDERELSRKEFRGVRAVLKEVPINKRVGREKNQMVPARSHSV
jgi:hypothetical protein